jgi:hypothetical protein
MLTPFFKRLSAVLATGLLFDIWLRLSSVTVELFREVAWLLKLIISRCSLRRWHLLNEDCIKNSGN